MTDAMIIGGGSGIGLALARTLLADGMTVTIVGRTERRLAAARGQLAELAGWERVHTLSADIAREDDVAALFSAVEHVDHIAVTAADATGVYGPTSAVTTAAARAIVGTKLFGAWLVAKYASGRVTSSITYTSGINTYRPNGSNTIISAANGALASLAFGLAIELAPVRVNVISPGWVDTPIWDQVAMDKSAVFADLIERLPARRIGSPDDIAQAFLAVMRNEYITGTVLHIDGGHRLI